MRKTLKDFVAKPSKEALNKVYSLLDKAVKKKIYSKNKVARVKANYSKKIGKIVSKPVAKKTVKKPVKKTAAKTSKKMS